MRILNHNVRKILRKHVRGCINGTKINAKDLSRRLSSQEYVYLAGTVAAELSRENKLVKISQTVYQVM